MASNTQTVSKLLRNLRDNGKVLLQCGALTYIRSNAEKMETISVLTKEEYAEICRLVMDMTTSGDQNIRSEATKALHTVLKYFRRHNVRFFESALRIDRDKRLKIFQLLESIDDSSFASAAQDPSAVNFIVDCLSSIEPNSMEWLLPTSCTEDLKILEQAERKTLSEAEEREEIMVINALSVLRKIYQTATPCSDSQSLQKFDTIVMDKVLTLAYMGHKRQRGPAIRMLNQAIDGDMATRVKTIYPDVYQRYKKNVQSHYSARMMLLVKACEPDWSSQWSISIRILGTDLHRGAALINKLLSVEERAFKSTDTMVRREAFVSWKLLIDNLALDIKELATQRRIRLLCVPLTANNSKSELIALKKLEVWWYLIMKLYPNIAPFADPVVTQFLNFCFGPLGDTPLLSTKVDVIASPGKRFYRAKIIAIDSLLQLIVVNQKDRKMFPPVLEERLPSSISENLFTQCYKQLLHSVGEAIIIVSKLDANEMQHREDVCKVLWINLMHHIRTTGIELKANVYNELMLVITELQSRSLEVDFVNDFLRNVIIPELAVSPNDFVYCDRTLMDTMTKVMVPNFLKNLQGKQCEAVKCLMWQVVRPSTTANYHSDTLRFLETTLQGLRSVPVDDNSPTDCFELWFAYAEIAHKFMRALQDVNEGSATETNFKTVESIISFPFTHMYWANSIQAQKIAVHWKDVYKKYECQADTIPGIKPNEIFDNTSKMIGTSLQKNAKCYRIAVYCLDALMGTINYKFLLAQNRVPPIIRLVSDLTTVALREGQPSETECALKALSSLLITVYGHSPEKVISYMDITSQTVELMLKTDAEGSLVKEIVSTWETIVSILRGLNNLLDEHFLRSYKQVILSASQHANTEISSQALSVLGLKDNIKESAKAVLGEFSLELKKLLGKDSGKMKTEKTEKLPKSGRVVGSFLNRKAASPKTVSIRGKEEAGKKLAPLPPEPDSQDYVVIKSDVKLDVNRLTEHQKESFKRRREDIPALYNDLSQSSSQDTQDLQNWFAATRKIHEPAKPLMSDDKKSSIDQKAIGEKIIDDPLDAKAREIIAAPQSIDSRKKSEGQTDENVTRVQTPEVLASSAQVVTSGEFNALVESLKSDDVRESVEIENEELPAETTTPRNDLMSGDVFAVVTRSSNADLSPDDPSSTIAKKLNFDSREEYPEAKKKEQDENLPTPILPSSNKTSRSRRSSKVTGTNLPDENAIQPAGIRGPAKNRGKTVGTECETKNSQSVEIPTITVEKSQVAAMKMKGNTTRSQTNTNIGERGGKRKIPSDTENVESNERDKKRRKTTKSPSLAPEDTESNVQASQTDKRTESEISRLRIDMISDGPLTSRRRSKYNDDFVSSEILGKRSYSGNPKGSRGKTGRSKTSCNTRRNSGTPENDEAGKRRRRRTAKVADDDKLGMKNDEDELQTVKPSRTRGKRRRNVQEAAVTSESQTIIDDDETMDDSATSSRDSDKSAESVKNNVENRIIPAEEVHEDITNSTVEINETPTENDFDEVVESSQDTTLLTSSHKRTFGKILKLKNTEDAKSSGDPLIEAPFEDNQPRASSPIIPSDISITAENNDLGKENIVSDDPDETFLDISAIRPQLADDVPIEEAEKKAPEASKTTVSPISIKASDGNFSFSSPKGHAKRFMKPKVFASQGRAAHMLGLVTKLAVLEKDGQLDKGKIDEEITTVKRMRTRENDSEATSIKRSCMVREPERIGSPSGSRQEKIFNNMKAADYGASPPAKLFCNLKNNGEKISPKMEKSQSLNQETTKDDEANNISLTNARDELPMLEWSSANPPSLTASPSVSILKRNRSIVPNEVEADTTPTRAPRKRVSFADPPVSKEMGYEIEAAASPHKITKFGSSRGSHTRKDSPIRIKQSRFMMIWTDNGKADKQEEPRSISCDVDVNCQRDNELLIKIAEDLEETVSLSPEKNDNSDPSLLRTNLTANIDGVKDIEEIKSTEVGKNTSDRNLKSGPSGKNVLIEEAQTQDDLFNSSDEKPESLKQSSDLNNDFSSIQFNMSGQGSNIESFKLNVTDDSVIGSITDPPTEETNDPESLEDTIDARNITNLNSTDNSEEAFDGVPVRTSTQRPDPISEMDTLPIGDSLLVSLPMTEDSQGISQNKVEIAQPELLDSTDAIYPNLRQCHRPIEEIIDSLTNPLWRKNLLKYLETRCIRTVGDLARLSEREIVRIPVKGSSKIEFVRKVLSKFERKLGESGNDERPNDDNSRSERLAPCAETEAKIVGQDEENKEMPMEIAKSLGDISALDGTSDLPGDSTYGTGILVAASQGSNPLVSIENSDPRVRRTLGRTSTTNSISTIIIDSSTEPEVSTILENAEGLSQMSTINLSSDTTPPTTTKSVGTLTDPPAQKNDISVETQTKIDELLDEIEVDLLLQSVVKRTSAEKLLTEYKLKMGHKEDMELCEETFRLLGIRSGTLLKLACQQCGLQKVLTELPNIFYDGHGDSDR